MTEEEDQALVEEYRECKALVEGLEPLVASEGWKLLRELLEKQIRVRQGGNVPEPSRDFGAVFEREFRNGEVAALLMVAALPEQVLAQSKQLVAEYNEYIENRVKEASNGE